MRSKVNILGTPYKIVRHETKDDIKLQNALGYAELFSKELVVSIPEDSPDNFANIRDFENKVARHEITHAFFYESGLFNSSDFAANEELVDWIAIQGKKLYEAWKEADVL